MSSSQKITGKNLHYDQSLPPFLARLKGQHAAAAGDGPDPLLASRRRAAKTRSASEEAEDAPVVVDDEGRVVAGARVGADGTVTGGGEAEEGEGRGGEAGEGTREVEEADDDGERANKDSEKVAAIGGAKKRKVGRIVGADAEDEDEGDGVDGGKKRARPTVGADGGAAAPGASSTAEGRKKEEAADDKSKAPGKAKKKAKKIKLSFGDDGD